MEPDYVFLIRNEKTRSLRFLSILLCIISAAFFILQFINGDGGLYFLLPAAIIVVGVIWNISAARRPMIGYNVLLGIAGLTWLFIPGLRLLALPFVLLAFFERKAAAPLKVSFYKDEIEFDSLLKKKYGWNSLSGVILKDGLLTIDFKSNRLIQKNAESEIEEPEFNRYCRQKLERAGQT